MTQQLGRATPSIETLLQMEDATAITIYMNNRGFLESDSRPFVPPRTQTLLQLWCLNTCCEVRTNIWFYNDILCVTAFRADCNNVEGSNNLMNWFI